jgi:hypothetical protein
LRIAARGFSFYAAGGWLPAVNSRIAANIAKLPGVLRKT